MIEIVKAIISTFVLMFLFLSLLKIFGIVLDICWDEERDRCFKIKFSQFKKFYSINPKIYRLDDFTVVREHKHHIKFNIIDTFKYIHFKDQIEKNKDIEHMNNQIKDYLNSVQNDINELNKKAQEEIEYAKKEMYK